MARLLATAAVTLVLAWPAVCRAQVAPGDIVPSRPYFTTLVVYNDGDYRAALTAFMAESRGAIKTPTSRWIDSICYFTMAGESYYQMGQLAQALDSYDSALKIYLANTNWMMRVQFPMTLMPATVGAVRPPVWGQSRRGTRIAAFPDTFMMGQGRIDNSAVIFQGGVVQPASLFPVNAAEIIRCTTVAMRRRREILGPITRFDPLTASMVEALARRPGPPNHWSQAWIDVQLGCAYAAAGELAQAKTALQQAVVVGGEFDHPLTSTALVELGRVSLETGDFAAARDYFQEASFACINYQNPGVLEEAFRLGQLAHLLLNQKEPYPGLARAADWARASNYRHLQASLLLSAAENLIVLGNTDQAATILNNARSLIGRSDLALSHVGARMNHLTATAAYQGGHVAAANTALAAALAFQKTGSVWNFQIALADSRYMNGDFSDRVGTTLYDILLRDPASTDWLWSPLDCLSVLTTPHDAALEHWFEAVINKEQEVALEIADRARRHRFYCSLPLGGRLTALRWVLEGPVELLGENGLLQRQDLLARYPRYAQLAQESAKLRTDLAAKPVVDPGLPARREQAATLARLAEVSENQELILHEIAVRREGADMVFPPQRKTRDVQKGLADGQVLMAFFATSRNLYGFLYSHDKYAAWKVQSPTMLQKQIGALLREMGNFDANHEVAPADLAKSTWRDTGNKVLSILLERSTVDLAGNFEEIAIVPDGVLWYLPFEALPVGKPNRQKLLISQARVRYAPTVGLAVPYSRVHKPHPRVGLAVGKLHPREEEATTATGVDELTRALGAGPALPRSMPVASNIYRLLLDELIVLDDIQVSGGPYDWAPIPAERNKSGTPLAAWLELPWGGPEQVLLPGFHTAAETAFRRGTPAGGELFLSLCGLMASGTRTILISRWRNGGETSFDVVRELAQELPHVSPAEAWQRAVQVVGNTQIDIDHEPRVKKNLPATDPLMGDHPLFWAGYMLVDSGTADDDKLLVLPGRPEPPQKGAQLANPGLAPGAAAGAPAAGRPAGAPPVPAFPGKLPPEAAAVPPEGGGQQPEAGDDDEAAKPTGKPAKKAKAAPRGVPKKSPAKSKPPRAVES